MITSKVPVFFHCTYGRMLSSAVVLTLKVLPLVILASNDERICILRIRDVPGLVDDLPDPTMASGCDEPTIEMRTRPGGFDRDGWSSGRPRGTSRAHSRDRRFFAHRRRRPARMLTIETTAAAIAVFLFSRPFGLAGIRGSTATGSPALEGGQDSLQQLGDFLGCSETICRVLGVQTGDDFCQPDRHIGIALADGAGLFIGNPPQHGRCRAWLETGRGPCT